MISESLLGRYEYVNPSENSQKYWWLMYDIDTRQYVAFWGRIKGHETPRETVYVGDDTAMKKIKEKIKKGYSRREGYKTVEGCNARHFILSLLEKEVA